MPFDLTRSLGEIVQTAQIITDTGVEYLGSLPTIPPADNSLKYATTAWAQQFATSTGVSGLLAPFSLAASVATNALTVVANGPTAVVFRNPTLTNGVPVTASPAANLSLTIPSGATLGTISTIAARLVWLLLYNAGTPVLAVTNLAGGLNLDETTLISTTAMSAGATSATVVYSTAAITNSPFRVIGFTDVTEATAGTWATAASTVQAIGGQALAALSSLGYGQTWGGVTRTSGTTYYNTTGRPILVKVDLQTASSAICTATVNGQTIGSIAGAYSGSGSQNGCGVFIVPPNSSYVLTIAGATAASIFELR